MKYYILAGLLGLVCGIGFGFVSSQENHRLECIHSVSYIHCVSL